MQPIAQPTAKEPSVPPHDRGRPRIRDLVVFREPRSVILHGIAQFPGEAQFYAGSRHEALRLADTFARAHRLDVWYRENQRYERIESFRPAADLDD